MNELSRMLGKAFLPGPRVCVMVCTVGGTDENGNDVYEPTIFEGYANEALKYFSDENNVNEVQRTYESMPDGYILVEMGSSSFEVYDASELYETIDQMI